MSPGSGSSELALGASTRAGKMMIQTLGTFGESEHGSLVKRTKVGMARKAQGGRWIGGVTSYGYQLAKEAWPLVQDDEGVAVRKEPRRAAG